MLMAELYNVSADRFITSLVGICEEVQTVNRITSQSIDGNTYIQIVGNPVKTYNVTACVRRSEKALLEQAEANCDLLRIIMSHGVYYGRITSLTFGERRPQDWFDAMMTVQKEVAL